MHPGELLVSKSDAVAGLDKDTKFDLRNIVTLPFDDEWFTVAPSKGHGEHPKRGKFDLSNIANKKKLQAAITERKSAHQGTKKTKKT